ncbi:YciI family protein [Saccharopolyspora taberi]|uniref:YciI family protein n=1 Tax=Saccharopolyspora taberi TaxID=60895 RepID=A0ABN3VEY6_9PSEU
MRFMMMVKADADSEAGVMPEQELIEAMGKYNEEMVRAGVMLAGDGLHPSSEGARVYFRGGERTVVDGPFAETKELIAGYWLIEVSSKEEAVEWARRCPSPMGEGKEAQIEIRRVYETDEILPPEAAAREDRLREELANRSAQ